MTDTITTLIEEARAWGRPNTTLSEKLMLNLAHALEAEYQRAERYHSIARRTELQCQEAEHLSDRFYEGLFNVYVQLGEDTDGARSAAELFGPMTYTDPAKWIPRLVRANRDEWEGEAEREETRANRYRAALEEVREWSVRNGYPGADRDRLHSILTRALNETGESDDR